ncbi:hypothetical protein XENOCAPTIV_003269 [Xenoophorus captivus]|uniref:Uncharacterized protein n=1 Tax=Xenoophorus captivus TaxID=1517983 RepID=A0ABV0RTB8_9TELE
MGRKNSLHYRRLHNYSATVDLQGSTTDHQDSATDLQGSSVGLSLPSSSMGSSLHLQLSVDLQTGFHKGPLCFATSFLVVGLQTFSQLLPASRPPAPFLLVS